MHNPEQMSRLRKFTNLALEDNDIIKRDAALEKWDVEVKSSVRIHNFWGPKNAENREVIKNGLVVHVDKPSPKGAVP
jgi:hypothetical protein